MPMRDPRSYLFIDGGYLRGIVYSFARDYFGVEKPGIDFDKIGTNHRRVFYYDCPAKPEDADAWDEQFEDVQKLPGWHVFTGVVTGKKRTQKQVDVKIAVDMLSHTLNSNMDSATLLAGDQDFVPVLDALVRAGMYVSLMYERKSASRELIRMAEEAIEITPELLREWCDPVFRAAYSLPTKSEFVSFDVDDKLASRDQYNRWDLICIGKTAAGQDVRVVRMRNQKVFAVCYRGAGSMEDAYLHGDAPLLKNYLGLCGLAFDVVEETMSGFDGFWT